MFIVLVFPNKGLPFLRCRSNSQASRVTK